MVDSMVTASAKPPEDLSRWLTVNEASDILGVSGNTIVALAARGHLHPAVRERHSTRGGPKTVVVYDPLELAKIPRRQRASVIANPGELAARAFEMFDNGVRLRDVVLRLRISPNEAETLHEKWGEQGGSEFVITPAAKLTLERHLGAFEGVAELVALVEKLCAQTIVATGDDDATDAELEHAIIRALDAAGSPAPAP